jgi:hypothetical protein
MDVTWLKNPTNLMPHPRKAFRIPEFAAQFQDHFLPGAFPQISTPTKKRNHLCSSALQSGASDAQNFCSKD